MDHSFCWKDFHVKPYRIFIFLQKMEEVITLLLCGTVCYYFPLVMAEELEFFYNCPPTIQRIEGGQGNRCRLSVCLSVCLSFRYQAMKKCSLTYWPSFGPKHKCHTCCTRTVCYTTMPCPKCIPWYGIVLLIVFIVPQHVRRTHEYSICPPTCPKDLLLANHMKAMSFQSMTALIDMVFF